ncbi:hypothetical protein HYFRA_00007282 [Hymenoscyphus fraxineus]|uniref:Uncharacterized protein n=1 Tax=Hymenoscyphus fraxineus TaxID=746836 RepID=A0A9N9KNZ6_9HELO|nr:hypothetical protein HYFRA_00007282 [Hymenoscyphus fraxineus]
MVVLAIHFMGFLLAAFHRPHYDDYPTKLQIAYYLVNPKGYHGVGFCHTEGIYQSVYVMVLGYSFLVGADAWLEANLKEMNPEYKPNPNPPGNISTTFIVFVFLVGFGLWVYMSVPFGRQWGWQFGIRRFMEELRNELGRLGGSFPKEEWMKFWISKFLTEKDLEDEDDLKCVKKCIDAIVKDISS